MTESSAGGPFTAVTVGAGAPGRHRSGGRWLLLGVALVVLAAGPAQAQPAGGLSPEEQRLGQKAQALNRQAVELYQRGQYAQATKLLQEALRIRERLYPRE